MKKLLCGLLTTSLTFGIGATISTAASASYVCTHSGGPLILRKGPGQNNGRITSLRYGTNLSVINSTIGRDGNVWLYVQAGRYRGWVHSYYVC